MTSAIAHRFQRFDSQQAAPDSMFTLALDRLGGCDGLDPLEQMAQADAADRSLLRLVVCAASATLVLALASSLV